MEPSHATWQEVLKIRAQYHDGLISEKEMWAMIATLVSKRWEEIK
jgi:hypothetical protein